MAEDKQEVATEQQQQQEPVAAQNGDSKPAANGETPLTNGSNGTTVEETPAVEPVKEMRSAVLNGFGAKPIKVMKKNEPAQPAEGEVLIRVQSAGLSFNDLLLRQGSLPNIPKPPLSLGFEAAGLVEAVGENAGDFKVGDRVACLSNAQCCAELVLVNSKYVYKLPEGIDFDNAVALTLNYVFAHYLLFEVANLKPNQSVFIQSCAGGVGQALVQLASTVDNVTVLGTASKHKHEKIEKVAHLFDHSDDYVAKIKELYPDGVNLVLDCLYGDINKGFGLLKALGHYVLYGSSNVANSGGLLNTAKFWWSSDKIKPVKLFEEHNKSVSGFSLRQFLYQQNGHDHVRAAVERVYALYLEGKIKPTIDSRFAFEDVNDALARLQDRQNVGKVVLDVNLQPKPVEEEPAPVKKSSRFSTKNLLKKSSEKKEAAKEEPKEEKKQNGEEEKPEENKTVEENAESKPVESAVTNGGDKAIEA